MNLSGILIVTAPQRVHELCARVAELPGVEIHQLEAETGRMIAVQEAESINQEMDGLKAIKQIPGIILAEMVYHYFAEDDSPVREAGPDELSMPDGLDEYTVPAALNQ